MLLFIAIFIFSSGTLLIDWIKKKYFSPKLFKILRVIRQRPSRTRDAYNYKVHIILKNVSDKTLYIHWATFGQDDIPDAIPIRIPPKLKFEKAKGPWERDIWRGGDPPNNTEISANSQDVIRTWIALVNDTSQDEIDRLCKKGKLGTLILKINGYQENVKIPIKFNYPLDKP